MTPEQRAAYRRKHADRIREENRRYREKHREQVRASGRVRTARYHARHPEKRAEQDKRAKQRRRAAKAEHAKRERIAEVLSGVFVGCYMRCLTLDPCTEPPVWRDGGALYCDTHRPRTLGVIPFRP